MNTIKEYIKNSKELTKKEKEIIEKIYENALIRQSDADLESIADQLLEKALNEDGANE
jgi:uncharacterized membrane-anchored protein